MRRRAHIQMFIKCRSWFRRQMVINHVLWNAPGAWLCRPQICASHSSAFTARSLAPITGCMIAGYFTMAVRSVWILHSRARNVSRKFRSHFVTDVLSAGRSRCRAPLWTHNQISLSVMTLLVLWWWGVPSDETTGLSFVLSYVFVSIYKLFTNLRGAVKHGVYKVRISYIQ
jgi:hypothetical protein